MKLQRITRLASLFPLFVAAAAAAGLHADELAAHPEGSTAAAVQAQITLLDAPDPLARQKAARALSRLGPDAGPAVPTLLAHVEKDDDPKVRRAAAEAVGRVGAAAKDTVPALLHALDHDRDAIVQRAIAIALGRVEPEADSVVPPLLEMLRKTKESELLTSPARQALVRIGKKSLPALRAELKTAEPAMQTAILETLGDLGPEAQEAAAEVRSLLDRQARPEVRRAAGSNLARIDPTAPETIAALGQHLEDPDEDIRIAIIQALESLGPAAKEVIPVLVGILRDPNASLGLKLAVCDALGGIKPNGKDGVTPLQELLKQHNRQLQEKAIEILRSLGPIARDAVPDLLQLLKEPEVTVNVRLSACEALGNIGPNAEDQGLIGPDGQHAVDTLTELLQDTNWEVRKYAAVALRQIGPRAKKAIPALLRNLNDRDDDQSSEVRAAAADALGDLGPSAVVITALKEALKDDAFPVRVAVVGALAKARTQATTYLPLLAERLRDNDRSVRLEVAEDLASLGPAAAGAVPQLIQLLEDDDLRLRGYVVNALVHIGKPAVGQLRDVLKQNHGVRCESAASILGQMGADAGEAVPDLMAALQVADEPYLRRAAVEALGFLDVRDAAPAIPFLRQLVEHTKTDDPVHAAAEEALQRLGPPPPFWTWFRILIVAALLVTTPAAVYLVLLLFHPQTLQWVNQWIKHLERRLSILLGRRISISLELPAGVATSTDLNELKEVLEAKRLMEILFPEGDSFQRPGIEIGHCRRQATTVSGDFYDFVPRRDGSLGIYSVDIEGHGLPAAYRARAVYQTLFQLEKWGQGQPQDELERADEVVGQSPLFQKDAAAVCMNFMEIDPVKGVLRHANAGMPYPLLFRRGATQPEYLRAFGLYVGEGYSDTPEGPDEDELPLRDGDLLVLVSDGITEAADVKGRLFGKGGIAQAVLAARDQPPCQIARAILHAARRHSQKPNPDDDQIVLVVKYTQPAVGTTPPRTLTHDGKGRFRLLVAPDVAEVCSEQLLPQLRDHVSRLGFTNPERLRQLCNCTWEALQNAVKYGVPPGDRLDVHVLGLDDRGWVKVALSQPLPWDAWKRYLGWIRKSRVADGAFLQGGTVLMLWIADEVVVSDRGRRTLLYFGPDVKPERDVQLPAWLLDAAALEASPV
jgi:HEAT repeat protein/serine phosphatase RsbU (regulator of sigma subunit)